MTSTKKQSGAEKKAAEAAAEAAVAAVPSDIEMVAVTENISVPNLLMNAKLWKAFVNFPDAAGVNVPLGVKILSRLCPEIVQDVATHSDEANALRFTNALSNLVALIQKSPAAYAVGILKTPRVAAVSDGIRTLGSIEKVQTGKLAPQFRCDGVLFTAVSGDSFSVFDILNAPDGTYNLVYDGTNEAGERVTRLTVVYGWNGYLLRPTDYTLVGVEADAE